MRRGSEGGGGHSIKCHTEINGHDEIVLIVSN